MTGLPLPSAAALAHHVARVRAKPRDRPPDDVIVQPMGDEESVWDYPRPPRVEEVPERIRVVFAGHLIADSERALRVVETAGAPCYYLPPSDCELHALTRTNHWTICEWKGIAFAYDVAVGEFCAKEGAWSYPEPLTDLGMGYERIAGYFAFYAAKMEACLVGAERAVPQSGGYYGGWVTSRLVGPIKGAAGSQNW